MAHPRARLTVFGRQLLVTRVTALGWTVAAAARAQGVSRETGYRWLRRYRSEGPSGLVDRNSRPHRSPRSLPAERVAEILAGRARTHYGPDRLGPALGLAPSTVHRVLRRHGLNRLDHQDAPTGAPVRYVACHPGALVHQDHKKLARIPDGGGHRATGRSSGYPHRGAGYEHYELFVDDTSRVAFAVPVEGERPEHAAHALELAAAAYAELGVRIERVLTDNGGPYRSRLYAATIERLGVRHKRTRPYRPQTNGKVERFIRTLLAEWAYARPYRTNEERRSALADWVWHYDHERPHTALGSRTPMSVLVNNVRGDHS